MRGEYEAALAEVAAAEQERMIEISRLAGQEALNEITREDGRAKRQVLDADLAEPHLPTLRLALPEVERRAAEEVETHPEARDQAVG